MSELGFISELNESKKIEWKIPCFSSLNASVYVSPSFTFADTSWHLSIYPDFSGCELLSLYLHKDTDCPCHVTFEFSIENSEGTLIGTKTTTDYIATSHGFHDFFKTSVLKQRKLELLPYDCLTLICNLTLGPIEIRKRKHKDKTNFSNKKYAVKVLDNMKTTTNVARGLSVSNSVSNYEESGSAIEEHEEKEIIWEIANFFSVAENEKVIKYPSFSFGGISWYLRLYPKSATHVGFMHVILEKEGSFKCSVDYNFGLKKSDESIEHLGKGILKGNQKWGNIGCIRLSEIQQRKSELMSSDKLIFVLTLRHVITHSVLSRKLDPFKFRKLDTLSKDFENMFLKKENCDTTLVVMGKEYCAHRTILMARSSVFAAMFRHDTSEKQTGTITIPDCDPESFETFLKFLYCGKVDELSIHNILHLYETSVKYDVHELKTHCIKFLMENLMIQNFCEIVIIADKYDEKDLLFVVQDFFNKNAKEILETTKWDSLVENNYHLSKKLLNEMLSKVKTASEF